MSGRTETAPHGGGFGAKAHPARLAWATAIVTGLLAPAVAFAQMSGSFERTLLVSGPVDLDVSTAAGRITIGTGRDGTVEVRGQIRGRTDRRVDRERVEQLVRELEENPPIVQTGNTIAIGDLRDGDRRERVSISYEIIVPVQTRAESRTGSGGQTVDGIAGPLEVHTGSGGLEVSNIGGDVRAQSGSGSVIVESVRGDVDVRAGSGGIRAIAIEGDLNARTGSGGIAAEGTPRSEWSLRAGSGPLEVDVPDDAGFDLRAETNSGSIDSAHPIQIQGRLSRRRLEGRVRGGGIRLELKTGSGSIRIR
jgi:hypothetical protein